MKDGRFFAFDILRSNTGQDLTEWPISERIAALTDFSRRFGLLTPTTGNGGEFLEAVLARGGEGIVAKPWDAPYGTPWFKAKRRETLDLIVTEKHQVRASIRLGTVEGEDRGWCPCGTNWFCVTVGDFVEVSAYAVTAKGKLREPVFIRTRHDKASALQSRQSASV